MRSTPAEGGGIEVNGQGTLLATLGSIFSPDRNPGKTQEEIGEALRHYLGATHFIWLTGKDGMGDTDSHIDGAARFAGDSTVLYSWTGDGCHPRDRYFRRHLHELEQAVTKSGKPLTLVPVPATRAWVYKTIGASTAAPVELALSLGLYANSYVANIGLIQMSCGDDIEANHGEAVDCVRQAASRGANIVCLQELFKSRHFCQFEKR